MIQLRHRRAALLACGIGLAALLLPQTASAATFTIRIMPATSDPSFFRFNPGGLTIYVGDTVHFEFDPGANETVTHSDVAGSCTPAASPLFDSSTSFDVTFTAPGSYAFFSKTHCPLLRSTIEVLELPAGSLPLPGDFTNAPVTYPTFQPHQVIRHPLWDTELKTPRGPHDVGDIDGDGLADALGIRLGFAVPGDPVAPTEVYTIFGRLHATPLPPADPWLTTLRPEMLALRDFNGDARADLVVFEGGVLSYLAGNGDGTFGAPQAILSGLSHFVHEIPTADLDRDGHLDILVPDATRIVLLYGNGDGTFQPAVSLAAPGAPELFDVDAADVNGDGRLDLVAFRYDGEVGGQMLLYLQTASGAFSLAQTVAADPNSFGYDIATGDINGDGFADVAASNQLGHVSVFFGSAAGLSVPLLTGWNDSALLMNNFLLVADFDLDGKADIAVSNGPEADYISYISGANLLSGAVYNGRVRMNPQERAADMNGDGLLDFVGANGSDGGFVLLLSGEADTTPPDISVPAGFSVEVFSTVTFSATAHDAVFGDLPVICSPSSPFVAALGPNEVTCTATDGADNVGLATFVVTGVDTTPPVLSLPGTINATATTPGGAVVSYSATATDGSGSATVTCAPASGATFPIGSTPVNCMATDAAGNSASGSFTVAVASPNLVTLIRQLQAQAAAAGMSQGDNNLDNVIKHLTKANGNTLTPACNNLNAFIRKATKLSQPAQSEVIEAALNAGAFIGCR